MTRLTLPLLLLLVPAGAARAAILRVPEDFATIAAAVTAASSGDTLRIGPGTYREAIVASAKDLTFESTGGAGQTYLAGPASAVPSNAWIEISSYSTLRGFTLSSTPDSLAWVLVEGAGVGVLPGALIADNVFDGSGAGPRSRATLTFNDSAGRVRGNVFRGWAVSGTNETHAVLEVINGGTVVVENNLFVDNDTTAVSLNGNFRANRVVNNNFAGNRRAIRLGFAAGGATLRNNILADNAVGLDVRTHTPSQVWTHNLVWGNGTDYLGIPDPTGLDGNLRADPEFADGRRLELGPGSPAIDNGTGQDAPDDDFAGAPRPVDGDRDGVAAWDIGAIERSPLLQEIPSVTAAGAALFAAILGWLGLRILGQRGRAREAT